MKKIQLIFSFLLFLSLDIFGQSTPTEGTTEYGKVQVPCYHLEVPHPPDVTEDAIKNKFKEMGASGKERKGFYEYNNVKIPQIREALVDVYIKVDRKSKKENTSSNITMIVTEPGEAPDSLGKVNNKGVKTAAIASVGVLGLMATLSDNTEDLSIDLDIKSKEEALRKVERENENLIKDGNKLENKLTKLKNDIEVNKNDQLKIAQQLAQKREALVAAQGKKKFSLGDKKKKDL
ncbi:MAG: hypothetical protein WEA59_04980 [Ferruginibacter sp.]